MWPGCNLQGAKICCVGQLCHTAVLSSGIQAVFIPIVITDEEHSVIPPALSLGKVGSEARMVRRCQQRLSFLPLIQLRSSPCAWSIEFACVVLLGAR